jgi:hypothetical protein
MSEFRNVIKTLYEFDRGSTNGFNYVFEKHLEPNTEIFVKLPTVSANKRGINDIAWMVKGDGALFGTIAKNPFETDLWQLINENDEVNKVTSVIKIVSGESGCDVAIRAILN